MVNNKSPGNDDLTNDFYKTFWNKLKELYIISIKQAFHKKVLSTSQRQTMIRLIEEKYQDKQYVKYWRSISLLNVDAKSYQKPFSKN